MYTVIIRCFRSVGRRCMAVGQKITARAGNTGACRVSAWVWICRTESVSKKCVMSTGISRRIPRRALLSVCPCMIASGAVRAKIKLPRDCRGALACLEGFEPPTFWFVAKHSIRLSYKHTSLIKSAKYIIPRFCGLSTVFSKLFSPFPARRRKWVTARHRPHGYYARR